MRVCPSLFVIFTILSCCYSDTEVHGKYFGRGVCSVHLRDEKVVNVDEVHFYNETSWEFCWSFPPWCKVITGEAYKYGPTLVNITHEHLKLKCCPGYRSNAKATSCIPICSSLCKKGYCIDVGNCTLCTSGHAGPQCDKKVPASSSRADTGPELQIECNCTDDNYVCASNGSCVCAPGFQGTDCTTIVDPNAFIVDPGEQPSCMTYFVRVSVFLALIVLISILIFAYIRKRFDIVQFRPLLSQPIPSTSRSYTST